MLNCLFMYVKDVQQKLKNAVSSFYCAYLIIQTCFGFQMSSLFRRSHSNTKLFIVWPFVPRGHNGVSIILNRCIHYLMLPCPINMDVKFWVMFIFMLSLSAIPWKYSFVISPFVVWSPSFCHLSPPDVCVCD
jgi:hypothetical protein